MAAYPLSEVLTSILTSLSSAQRQSDVYSLALYKEGVDTTDASILPVPWSQLTKVDLALRFAIASVSPDVTGTDNPQIDVYVTSEDLAEIDPKDVSTLNIEIDVSNQEYVTTDNPG